MSRLLSSHPGLMCPPVLGKMGYPKNQFVMGNKTYFLCQIAIKNGVVLVKKTG